MTECNAINGDPCQCPGCHAEADKMEILYKAGKLNPEPEPEDCDHWEHENGYCIDCGESVLDKLIGDAERRYEGDR